jgi:hypothetical protein
MIALDEFRLKKLALESWRRGGLDSLVKVLPLGLKPDRERQIGYCTSFKFVAGRTPVQMEQVIGLRSGSKLAHGASIYRVVPLPTGGQFDLKGYTQLPGGMSTVDVGYQQHADYPPGLGAPQWDLARLGQGNLAWLADVLPGQRFAFPANQLRQLF